MHPYTGRLTRDLVNREGVGPWKPEDHPTERVAICGTAQGRQKAITLENMDSIPVAFELIRMELDAETENLNMEGTLMM